MNPAVMLRRLAERLAGAGRQHVLLRLAAALASVAVLVLIPATGGEISPFTVVVLVVLTAAAVLLPDGWAPLVLLAALAGTWARTVPDLADVRSVVAAALLFTVHLCCTLSSYGPPDMALPRELLLAWVRRGALAVGTAVAVWLVAWSLGRADMSLGPWASLAALALLLGWTGFLYLRLVARPAESSDRR